MRNLLAICVALLSVGMTAGQDRGGRADIRDRFAGAWRLAWLEQPAADGTLHRVDCCGMFVFTREGHLSVQVMERGSPVQTQAQTPGGPEQYSQGGYEASWGTYKVDEHAHTFTFHVDGALVRTLIGKDLPRAYEFSGRQLIVKSTRPDEHWRVAWERY
jgi:Lipocalin-like domain